MIIYCIALIVLFLDGIVADDALQMHTWMTRLDTPLHVAALDSRNWTP